MSHYDKTCEVCGTPVRVVGETTMSYESAYEEAMAMVAELSKALETASTVIKIIGAELKNPIAERGTGRDVALRELARWKEGR
jgi:hypothetical protein